MFVWLLACLACGAFGFIFGSAYASWKWIEILEKKKLLKKVIE